MTEFQYFGEWEFDLKLDIIAQLKSNIFFKTEYYEHLKLTLDKGFVPLVIIQEKKADNPNPEQINAINWIIQNQEKIWMVLFAGLKEKIFPYYIDLWQDQDEPLDENYYPELITPSDLVKALGIEQIEINTENRDEISYYHLYFKFCSDPEHGIIITMHNDRLIDFCGMGDIDNRKIIEDMGLNYDNWLEEQLSKMK